MAGRFGGGRSGWERPAAFAAGAAVLVGLSFFCLRPDPKPRLPAAAGQPAQPAANAVSAAVFSPSPEPAGPAGVTPLNAAILREARRILAAARSTQYSHKNQIDEKAGRYELDCSGYVRLVLGRVAPASTARFRRGEAGKGLLAADYERAFEKAPADPAAAGDWLRIETVADLRPGDLIAWRYAHPEVGHTGHIMILAGLPEAAGAGIYKLPVLESTSATHTDANGREQTGLRQDWLWLEVDAADRPVGFRRSDGRGKFRIEPIALGRLLR